MVAARIRRALPYVPAERIVVAPDCGMKYLPRAVAVWEDARHGRGRRNRAPGIDARVSHCAAMCR